MRSPRPARSDAEVGPPIRVLWLCGPPGVGKTTIAVEIHRRMRQAGVDAGYIDIDQLGICYPEPDRDPGRHRLKARNLGAVVETFRTAGARCVIVSGVVDSTNGVHHDELTQAAVTVYRLRSDAAELKRRITARGTRIQLLDAMLREAEALDRSDFADLCVDTTGRDVAEVVESLRRPVDEWLADVETVAPASASASASDEKSDGPVLWLSGATGVGKSSVGWAVFQEVFNAGIPTGFIDLEQIGLHRPDPGEAPGDHTVRARNLAAVWRNYRAVGARCLVVVGTAETPEVVRIYRNTLPAADLISCRLHAGRAELARRIGLRGQGGGPVLPGDQIAGLPDPLLRQLVDKAAASAESLQHQGIGDFWIDTDSRTAAEAARAVIAQGGDWPGH